MSELSVPLLLGQAISKLRNRVGVSISEEERVMVLGWLTVDEALEKILGYASVLEPEEKAILECLDQVLAEDVVSEITIPPLDNTAMDGYAVRWEDVQDASPDTPVALKVIEELPAGRIAQNSVERGEATRIMTGAPIPDGADTIVQFEDTDEEEQKKQGKGGGLRDIKIFSCMGLGAISGAPVKT